MDLPIPLSEFPPRLSAGGYILYSGLSKRTVDEGTAAGLHDFASGTYPFLKSIPPQQFVRVVSTAEVVVGAALLTPFVPTAVAGAALTAFSGGVLGLYLRTPGMRKPGSLAPTEEGIPLAEVSWLVGIGIGMLLRGLTENRPRVSARKADKQVRKAARAGRREGRRAR